MISKNMNLKLAIKVENVIFFTYFKKSVNSDCFFLQFLH